MSLRISVAATFVVAKDMPGTVVVGSSERYMLLPLLFRIV
jgi:hypothetical protein